MVVGVISGSIGLVEAMHTNIARKPIRLAGAIVGGALNGSTSIVYKSAELQGAGAGARALPQ